MTPPRRLIGAPVEQLDTSSRLEAIGYSGRLEPDDAAFVLRVAAERRPKWRMRQDRLAARDEAIRRYAARRLAHLASIRSRAIELANDLMRAAAVKASPEKSGGRRAELLEILDANDGEPLGFERIRDILAGASSG